MTAPQEQAVRTIKDRVERLRDLVKDCSTLSVVGACFSYHLSREPDELATLESPARQWSFLLGLLLASPQPSQPREFTAEDQEAAEQLLNEAFGAYSHLYYPSPDEISEITAEWRRTREVAMPAFLHFVGTRILATGEQVAERVRRYATPFDDQLAATLGLSATDALAITDWICARLQEKLDRLSDAARVEKGMRLEILDDAEREGWTLDDFRKAAQKADYWDAVEPILEGLTTFGQITREELVTQFPETGQAYWDLFAVERGQGHNIEFPTQRPIVDDRPLIVVAPEVAMCPASLSLYLAVSEVAERTLQEGAHRDTFFRRRDRTLEQEARAQFERILDEEAAFYSGIYETPDHQHEHDLVITWKSLCLLVEVKASPPVEPFRDPEKAYVRLRRGFRSDSGIQGAYNQSVRLWRRLASGETVRLFDGSGQEVVQLRPNDIGDMFCVCVTRDDFGPLATNLALLLEKSDGEPFPWAVNVLDLGALADAWEHFRWGPQELREYLYDRIRLHGRILCDDELDVAGYFIRHGGLSSILETHADYVHLNPTYSSIFDEIYHHVYHDGPRPQVEITEPALADVRASIERGEPVFVTPRGQPIATKVGRNQPCHCGSGKKYKKCCGRPSMRS